MASSYLHHTGLDLLKQTSSSQERLSVNGSPKLVHVVVKNAPFVMQIGLASHLSLGGGGEKERLDLNNFALDVSLLYDDIEQKEVDYVKLKPIDFKTTVSDLGDQATLEIKIKVLTSQHENSFFRIKICASCPQLNIPLEVRSEPIKVISKPETLKKKASSKKRNLNDLLVESITRIEQQQKEQQKLIEHLIQKSDRVPETLPHQPVSLREADLQFPQKYDVTVSSEAEQFEGNFRKFFQSFNSIPADERPVKIRKLIKNFSRPDTEKISELLDLFLVEGLLQRSGTVKFPSTTVTRDSSCNCPHQQELLKIDEFYKDFLTSATTEDFPLFA